MNTFHLSWGACLIDHSFQRPGTPFNSDRAFSYLELSSFKACTILLVIEGHMLKGLLK